MPASSVATGHRFGSDGLPSYEPLEEGGDVTEDAEESDSGSEEVFGMLLI